MADGTQSLIDMALANDTTLPEQSRNMLGGNKEFADYYNKQPSDMPDYYDPTTLMPKVLGASEAAAQGGTTLAGLAGGFFPKNLDYGQGYQLPSDKGGFFNVEDLFRQLGHDVPRIGTARSNAPSTNNWRLLGMGPGWIMRNGNMINTNAAETRFGANLGNVLGGGNSGEQHMWGAGGTALGTGAAMGVPNLVQRGLGFPISYGWPGAMSWAGELGTGMDRTT
jgi:hypothetical protein